MKKAKHDWTSHIEAIKTQGISTRAYANRHDLGLSALYYWQRKLKLTSPVHAEAGALAVTRASSKFVALRLSEPERVVPPASTHCTLVLAGGLRLEMPTLPSPQWLADLDRRTQGAR
jgi:transposase-like protein